MARSQASPIGRSAPLELDELLPVRGAQEGSPGRQRRGRTRAPRALPAPHRAGRSCFRIRPLSPVSSAPIQRAPHAELASMEHMRGDPRRAHVAVPRLVRHRGAAPQIGRPAAHRIRPRRLLARTSRVRRLPCSRGWARSAMIAWSTCGTSCPPKLSPPGSPTRKRPEIARAHAVGGRTEMKLCAPFGRSRARRAGHQRCGSVAGHSAAHGR
jgi:hypothetical protein